MRHGREQPTAHLNLRLRRPDRGIGLEPRAVRASLAGRSLSARRDLDRRRRQLRALLRARDEGRAVPVRLARRHGRVARIRAARADRHGLARLPARRAPDQLYGYRVHGPYEPARRPPLQSATRLSSIRTPRRSARTIRWADELFGYRVGDPTPTCRSTTRQRRVRAAGGGRRPGVHLGRRPAAAHAVAQDGHLRDARRGLHASAIPTFPKRCAAPTRR